MNATDYRSVTVVGLDADDTLWHSENRFKDVHERYQRLLERHVDIDPVQLEARMLATEQRNLQLFGYGAKAFTLSLIETAIELTDGTVPVSAIETILSFGKELLEHPVELLPGVDDALDALDSLGLRLLLITKGDLWHQESKIAASGLADRFAAVEIVSEKDPETYAAVLARHDVPVNRFCMVGNSVRSDVAPVLQLGGAAIHVPYEHLWAHEAVTDADCPGRFVTVDTLAEVPARLRPDA